MTAMPITATLETEILQLRQRIRDEEATEARLREAADGLLHEAEEAAKAGHDRYSIEWITKIDDAYKEPDAKREYIGSLQSHLGKLLERAGRENGGRQPEPKGVPHNGRRRGFELAARSWVEDESYAALSRRVRAGGNTVRLESDPVEVLTRQELVDNLRQRATFDTTAGGAMIPIDQIVYPPVLIPQRQVRLLQLIDMAQTDSDQVKWSLESTESDVATPTPYGTVAPEAAMTFTPVTSSVERIPVFIPATKDQLADQSQTQSLLSSRLGAQVMRQLEYQVLSGPGTAGTFTGILGTTGIGTYARNPAGTGGPGGGPEYLLDAIHKGITVVRLAMFDEPDGIGLHPTTAELVWLSKDQYGRYLYPTGTEQQTLWGIPVTTTALFPVGTGVVAIWRQAYTVWMRQGLGVYASDGYLDFFTRGMVAILAELRAAGACQQPKAVCSVTGLT